MFEDVRLKLDKEGDYTVRLKKPAFKHYVFAVLHFDGHTDAWRVRLLDQNSRASFGEDEIENSFQKARQTLIDKIDDFRSQFPEYVITKVQSGYDMPPWLKRKRVMPRKLQPNRPHQR